MLSITQVHTFSFMLLYIFFGNCDDDTVKYNCDITVNEIASTLVKLLGADEDSTRIRELNNNLKTIDSFVFNKDKYAELLLNETMSTHLNETNFYNALNESDHFRFLLEKEPKSLYLKLKEKLNRDDIMKILSEKMSTNKFSKSGRKAMSRNFGKHVNHDIIEELVDKMIAKSPSDKHKFDFKKENNKYWDPQRELEDLKEYHQHDGRRIYKGERTTIRYYPFMVSVHVMGSFWCGGAIYWHDLVLTSAACLQLLHNNRFYRENPGVLKVRVGSNHSRIGGEMVEALELALLGNCSDFCSVIVTSTKTKMQNVVLLDSAIESQQVSQPIANILVFFHPGYNPRTLLHNIAIIRLRRHLFFSYHRVPKIIEISLKSRGLAPTSEVLLLGWGVTKMSQRLSYEPIFLNRKFLPIYPNVFCKEVYGKKFISETMFCAGTLTTGEGACDHDAGGPAIIAGKLVGIISFGPTVCGYPNIPTVFTLVGAYVDWIESVNESMPSYYRGRKRTTTLKPLTFPEYKIKKIYKEITGLTMDVPTPEAETITTNAKMRNRQMPSFYRGRKLTTISEPLTFPEYNTKKIYKEITVPTMEVTTTTVAKTPTSNEKTRNKHVMLADDSDNGFSIDLD